MFFATKKSELFFTKFRYLFCYSFQRQNKRIELDIRQDLLVCIIYCEIIKKI